MAIEKQPEAGKLPAAADDWFAQFLKILEIAIADTGQCLPVEATLEDFRLAALRAVKVTLHDSGIDDEAIANLFARVVLETTNAPTKLVWTDEMNRRRFELIDRDIQGTLSPKEQLELAGLTQLMREQIDSEENFPLEGARKLHQHLAGSDREATEPEP